MPKRVTIAALVLLGALGQPRSAEAQIGVKAGLSSATMSFEPDSGSPDLTETRARNGFVGGVFVLLTGNKVGGWQLEFLYDQKGARNLLRVDDELTLTYLSIPVLLHVDVWQTKGSTALFVTGGASADFNIKASYEADGLSEDVKDDIRTTDVGLHLGGGLEVGRLTLDARYSWGLLSAFEDGDLNGTFKNRAFAITAGLRFGK
jgi:Outer membrane protein beta-barrel domain